MAHTIASSRLELRLLQLSDADAIFAYASDPEVARFTSWPAHQSPADSQAFVAFVVRADADPPSAVRHTWGIRECGGTSVIGTIGLLQTAATVAEIHFALARPFWRRGYTTEAVQLVLGWASERIPSLEIIRSGCLAENVGSWRVLEKAGFRRERSKMITFGAKFDHRRLEVYHYTLEQFGLHSRNA